MKEDEIDYVWIRDQLLALVETYKEVLDKETVESVRHFVDHDEYEMGYEGLFIELMKAGFNPGDMKFDLYLNIGKLLGLDKKNVFVDGFWKKLTDHVNKFQQPDQVDLRHG
jgi:hypothetical protein